MPSDNSAESSEELAKMNSTEVPGLSAWNCLPIAVRLLIIADDANTVMDVVAGCDCESQPLAETTNRIPTAIVRFNWPRIGLDDTDSYSANYVPIRMSCSLFCRRVERLVVAACCGGLLWMCAASAANWLALNP
jgi:hypothetical protein